MVVAATGLFSRRGVLAGGAALGISAAMAAKASPDLLGRPSARVIVDNDFGGDPDGLFLLSHLLLSPSIHVPLVVGSHYKDFGQADLVPDKAAASVRKARELLRFLPKAGKVPVIAGSKRPLQSLEDRSQGPATAAIVQAIMTADPEVPLFYAAGGSLTEIAMAWLAEPKIGKRIKLVWIGGNEHPELAQPPAGPQEAEYNFSLDRVAAQVVFNQSDIEIWQIPRDAFRQMLIGLAELDEIAATGKLGRYLRQQVLETEARLAGNIPRFIFSPGETYTLGDTALVTLTALQSAFQPDTPTSRYVRKPTPRLGSDGSYGPNPAGRTMRVYSSIDANLTWRDFVAKLRRR